MIKIKTASLAAACLISAKKDIRYYLNGVQILVREDGAVHVRATDGNCCFDDLMPEPSALAPFELIIPLESAKLIAKSKLPEVEIVMANDGRYECAAVLFTPVEGKFPDCDRILPARNESFDDKAAHYNPDILQVCQAAMRIATGKKAAIYRIQNSPVGLMCRESATYPRCAISPLNVPKAFKDN
jgi:hypothetical protein